MGRLGHRFDRDRNPVSLSVETLTVSGRIDDLTIKGPKRKVDLRKITNAILYVLKGGVRWRMLPREFAPWKTVYHYFRFWRLAGLWDRIHDQLRDQVRVSASFLD